MGIDTGCTSIILKARGIKARKVGSSLYTQTHTHSGMVIYNSTTLKNAGGRTPRAGGILGLAMS